MNSKSLGLRAERFDFSAEFVPLARMSSQFEDNVCNGNSCCDAPGGKDVENLVP